MAVLRPSLEECERLDPPLNDGEMRVAQALSELDDGWTVYVQPRLGMDVPDFVAVHDTHGVCIVEVKDWSPGVYRQGADGVIEYRSGDRWLPSREQPRYQAYRYRSTVYEQFFALPGTSRTVTNAVRSVLVLPGFSRKDARRLLENVQVTPDEMDTPVYGGDDLRQDVLRMVTDRSCQQPNPLSILRLANHLVESEVVRELRMPTKLSHGALQVATNPNQARRRRVKGAAGSGKSFGLAARAARLAADGQRVLVLSFNVTLSHYLRSLVTARCAELLADPRRVAVTHFHGFCKSVADDALATGLNIDAFQNLGPNRSIARARQAFELGHEDRYDAVLVDEGQDFCLDWWNLLRQHVVTADGEMLLVADPTQDLYGNGAWTDESSMEGSGFAGPWTVLRESYRMPGDLVPLANRFAAEFLEGETISGSVPDHAIEIPGMSVASRRRWTNTTPGVRLGEAVGHEVVRLLAENPELRANDVVFLCEGHRQGLAAVAVVEAAGHTVHHVFATDERERRRRKSRFWPQMPGVKGCTVRSFKGWETGALVMGIGRNDDSARLAYVAMTRLKANTSGSSAHLSVVNGQPRMNRFQAVFEQWAPPLAALRVG